MPKIFPLTLVTMLLTVWALGGCSSFSSVSQNKSTNRIFDANYETVFKAAVEVLRDDIQATNVQENSESGIIEGTTQGREVSDSFRAKLFSGKGDFLTRVIVKGNGPDKTSVSILTTKPFDVASIFMDKNSTQAVERDFIDRLRLKLRAQREDDKNPVTPRIFQADVDILPAFHPQTKDNAYAVIMGIEDYRTLPTVDYARRDAKKVKEYLIKAFGYREENIRLLLDAQATRSDLEKYLETWLPNNLDKDGEVFIFYAGHGAPHPTNKKSYLVPYNGDPAYLDRTGYPVDRLYENLSRLPAKQIVVVLDSCFSGRGDRSVIAKGIRPIGLEVKEPELSQKNLVVFTAAQSNQVSSPFHDKRHGLLTYFFLKGLQGAADQNNDASIDVGELYSYLQPEVKRQARRMNQDQNPQFYPDLQTLQESLRFTLVK